MAGQEDIKLNFSHGHTKITIIYRATTHENDLKINRKDVPQLKVKKEGTTIR